MSELPSLAITTLAIFTLPLATLADPSALLGTSGEVPGGSAARSPASDSGRPEIVALSRRGLLSRAGRAAESESDSLVAPARCVGDYLEAVATAAPPRPSDARPPAEIKPSDPRWVRVRSYLSPRALAALDATSGPQPLAPWSMLGRDGAFLGYELMAARRAPRGAVVIVSRERTERAPGAAPVSNACAYLLGRVSGIWRIADKRCGRDFPNGEVSANYAGYWDEPLSRDSQQQADDWFGEDLE